MDKQIETFLQEVSAALADMVTAMNEKTQSSDQISAALADMVDALGSKSEGKSLDAIAKSIAEIRPQIVVNPAPVTVHVVEANCTFEVLKVTYDNHDRIQGWTMKKVVA